MTRFPARITARHKERYEIVCVHGLTHARLKTKEYFVDTQEFPTTGDFVMIHYIENGDSQIIATLPRSALWSGSWSPGAWRASTARCATAITSACDKYHEPGAIPAHFR